MTKGAKIMISSLNCLHNVDERSDFPEWEIKNLESLDAFELGKNDP